MEDVELRLDYLNLLRTLFNQRRIITETLVEFTIDVSLVDKL